MSPRLTDWSIVLATTLAFIAGIVSLISGHPREGIIFVLHGMAGLWLLLLLWGKFKRVWPRLLHFRRWDWRTIFGLLATLLVVVALGSGIWWVAGDASGRALCVPWRCISARARCGRRLAQASVQAAVLSSARQGDAGERS